MSASLKYKFIFLRNHKCGSTSVKKILDQYSDITGVIYDTSFHVNTNNPPWAHDNIDWWSRYFKHNTINEKFITISTTRNPWDRMVSLYHYKGAHSTNHGQNGFKEFIKKMPKVYNFKNFIFDKNGNKTIDYVIKIENMKEELPAILRKVGINVSEEECNVHLNKSERNASLYKSYYDDETKTIVENMFRHEIDYFKYEF